MARVIEKLSVENLTERQLNYLNLAVANSPSPFFDIDDYLWAIRGGKSLLFGIFEDGQELACFVIDLKAGKGRKILIMSLCGGENLKLWRDDLIAFLFDMARQNQCTDFTMLGPKAWQRVFPEVKCEGCVYSLKLI